MKFISTNNCPATLTIAAGLLCSLATTNSLASDEPHRHHDAHEHGAATMNISWVNSELEIELKTPAYNILGFEYQPRTADEKKLLTSSITLLEQPDSLLAIKGANCSLKDSTLESKLTGNDHKDGHDDHKDGHDDHKDGHDDHKDGHDDHKDEHSDFSMSYHYTCDQQSSEVTIDSSALFNRFSNMQEIDVQWISASKQSSVEINAQNPLVTVK